MNTSTKSVLKNINYTVTANFIVMGISILLNLIVPRYLGVNEYSYWQLYVFYSGYVGFFHLGWIDGIYLKIGGEKYSNLNKRDLGTQFWYLLIFQSVLALFIIFFLLINNLPINRFLILSFTSFMLVITNCRTFILFILQSTNRIKEYAQLSRNDRYIYIVIICIYLVNGGRNFVFLILIDVLSKLFLVLWAVYRIRDLIFVKWNPVKDTLESILNNIRIGINLMVGNIASMLIMGITRLLVERQWSIEVFGRLSLTISISNMFMTFINAIGVVMYPLLRRTDEKSLKKLYIGLRSLFVPLTYGILLTFIPLKYLLGAWLPQYTQSLVFMGILFPMIVYEGRMALLVSTYLKTIRREKIILIVNIITLVISLILSVITIYGLNSIYLTVVGIMLSLSLRCILAETLLLKTLEIKLKFKITVETLLTIIFVIVNMYANPAMSFIIYLISYIIFILLNAKSIRKSLNEVLVLIRK
ncbi:lipopolysaccharide biosynthesis protein [Enterococcus casseliflavus]|uniref:lipopolysaccharide biosynthesis protein n=1 Tax=Enterococcus casseliflavus TaxID=37734 RepID=UPI0039A67060